MRWLALPKVERALFDRARGRGAALGVGGAEACATGSWCVAAGKGHGAGTEGVWRTGNSIDTYGPCPCAHGALCGED